MFQQEATITAPNGLHTRPVAQFVKEAKGFTSEITVTLTAKAPARKACLNCRPGPDSRQLSSPFRRSVKMSRKRLEHLVKLMAELGVSFFRVL